MDEIDIIEQNAVDAAMSLQWEEAIILNKKIIKVDPQSLSAQLRLGYAYMQLHKIPLAKQCYKKALKIQSKNSIALENMERIKILEEKGGDKQVREIMENTAGIFIEIPGKTKAVSLVTLGQKKIIARLSVGQKVILQIKKRRVEARTTNDEYIGTLPDDISCRLMFFLKNKSTYFSFIKEAIPGKVVIFIQEELKGKSVMNHVSFPHVGEREVMSQLHDEDKVVNEDDLPEDNPISDIEIPETEKEEIPGIQTEDLGLEEEE